MRAVLVNYTGASGHWGMLGTSLALLEGLIDRGYDVSAINVDEISRLAPSGMTVNTLATPEMAARFESEQPETVALLQAADLVVVNGEGTLHGVRRSSLNLLFLIRWAAAQELVVKLVNFSCYPRSHSAEPGPEDGVYREALASLRRVVARDPISGGILERLGIRHEVGFDCLPLTVDRHFPGLEWSDGESVLFSGGASMAPETVGRLAERTAALGGRIIYQTGGHATFAEFERSKVFPHAFAGAPGVELNLAPGLGAFLHALADGVRVLVTGRFHYGIAAACLGTPVVLLESNSQKNSALAAIAGLTPPLPHDALADPRALETAVDAARERASFQRPHLARLGQKNLDVFPCAAGGSADSGSSILLRQALEWL